MTRRIVVFAAFDKGGIVHNYVLTYLKKLKAVADKIIFIADNEASETERQKLNGLADIAVFKPHGEYDFGLYKRGIAMAKRHGFLDGADELILCNDSCFSVGVFKGAFDKMTAEPCDFWGMCESVEQSRHLQSFFLVFKRSVFKNAAFCDFFDAVRKQPDFSAVVQTYEIPLLEHFEQEGFKGNAFVPPFSFSIRNGRTLFVRRADDPASVFHMPASAPCPRSSSNPFPRRTVSSRNADTVPYP